MPHIAIILVHYKTAKLLERAVQSLRIDLLQSGLDADLIVVDNGSRDDDRRALVGLGVRWIDAGGNRGYAGGLNLGVENTDADLLFFMNCDVEVSPGCMGALVQALCDGGLAAVGPRFYWDRMRSVLLPPTEKQDLGTEISRRLAGCSELSMTWARAHWRRHARRHWLAREAFRSSALSGALLGVRRDAWNTIGPFDEGFKLYYEETDWLQRLVRHGLPSLYIPEAEAVHLYNQSAVQEPEAGRWCIASAERYQQRYYGRLVCGLLKQLPNPRQFVRRNVSRLPGTLEEFNDALAVAVSPACRWIELSPQLSGLPATGTQVSAGRSWRLPADLWEHMAPGTYSLRTLNDCDEELQHFLFDVDSSVVRPAAAPEGVNA